MIQASMAFMTWPTNLFQLDLTLNKQELGAIMRYFPVLKTPSCTQIPVLDQSPITKLLTVHFDYTNALFVEKICDRFISDPGWTIVRDPYYQAPYAYKNDLWMGYDDKESMKAKVNYFSYPLSNYFYESHNHC